MSGFIRLERSAFEHPLLRDDKRFRAWFWMVAKACWKPHKFDVGGKIVELKRGQFVASRNQLASEWGWSGSAVERFLTRLETEQMIGRETGQGRSVITIHNYSKYNPIEEETGQATGQATGQPADKQRTAKEQGNKETKENKRARTPVHISCPDGVEEGVYDDFLKLRNRIGAPFTKTALAGYEREAAKAGWSLNDAIRESTERSWRGFKAEWVEKRERPKSEQSPQSPADWLAYCEQRVKKWREIGRQDEIEHWEREASKARAKLGLSIPNLRVVQ